MTTISFDVFGVPSPQGGSRAVPTAKGARLISTGGAGLRDWRSSVASAAAVHAPASPLDGPLAVDVLFRFPMPASRSKKLREAGYGWKSTKPDIDKLLRAVFDSLTASGLIADDARIVKVTADKVEVTGWTGATISVRTVDVS